ncbi:Holliday junction ATP-dependent DNA helicase RuvB [Geodia barretti]|uniref:Holliday junction ATP-dependent DNA helicase RuvB n=1 Tax=Geodia barretti TaxID=519541 RepID=A0AA35QV37_GEOBA|nr:Holliday junction ATP-dependent DNA helicase RuvB [Geodia barretti]
MPDSARERIVSGAEDAETSADRRAAEMLSERASINSEAPGVNDLRPRRFAEYIGQRQVVNSIQIAVEAAKQRGDTLDHALFHGPPGLGKTTISQIIAREMETTLVHTSGPALERPADVVGILSNQKHGDVLFIDEIHRLSHAVEEYLYSAMEDYRVDFIAGAGAFAKTINLPLQKFTLIGSTTRAGMLSPPLRERFALTYHLDYYSVGELTHVVTRSASILSVSIDQPGAKVIASRSRGTPRIANNLLRRVRDYAQVRREGEIDDEVAAEALHVEGVDELGLDRLDRLYLETLARNYGGGPAGINALAASANEEVQTLEDVVEPFLLKIGFIMRTPQGRRATTRGMTHVGAPSDAAADAGQRPLI